MKSWVCVFAAVLLLGPTAMADEHMLNGGALIVHHEAAIAYSVDEPPGGWCAAYTPYAISDPTQEVVRLDGAGKFVWYVLAAWNEPKEWCGVQFGFDDYSLACWSFLECEPCYPVDGLELSSSNWPGPNEGTAIVTTVAPWEGNWLPVYKFSGYAYAQSYGSTVIPITDYDPGIGPFCGFSNCLNPPQDFLVEPNVGTEIRRGGMGINTDGLRAAPQEFVTTAVCCIGTYCLLETEAACDYLGGEWHVDETTCWPNPCESVAVCCYTEFHLCEILTEGMCDVLPDGVWHPEWVSCDPNPCDDPSPVYKRSWGEIKSLYR